MTPMLERIRDCRETDMYKMNCTYCSPIDTELKNLWREEIEVFRVCEKYWWDSVPESKKK